jgi:hypothetical protein
MSRYLVDSQHAATWAGPFSSTPPPPFGGGVRGVHSHLSQPMPGVSAPIHPGFVAGMPPHFGPGGGMASGGVPMGPSHPMAVPNPPWGSSPSGAPSGVPFGAPSQVPSVAPGAVHRAPYGKPKSVPIPLDPNLTRNFELREVKIKDLPKLGRRTREGKYEGVPLLQWRIDVEAHLARAGGVWVLHHDPPPPHESEPVQRWYYNANAVVYAALLDSVRDIPTLGNTVRRFHAFANSAKLAYEAIFDHFARLSELTEDTLLKELQSMKPSTGETMRSYLSRFEDLRIKFMTYGVVPSDTQFVTQCLANLSIFWRDGMGELGRRKNAEIPWHLMCESLLEQDNRRRVCDTHGEGLLPLGWSKGGGRGESRKSSGVPRGHSPEAGAAHSAGNRPPFKPKGKGPASPSRSRPAPSWGRKPESDKSTIVCFCCLRAGHTIHECTKKPEGFRVTPEQMAKAFTKREELLAARKARGASSRGRSSPPRSSPPRGSPPEAGPSRPRGRSKSPKGKGPAK